MDFLGGVNILVSSYILFLHLKILKILSSFLHCIYLYLFYFIWNLLSYFYAINPVETLINIPRIGNTFFAILFCFLLLSKIRNSLEFVFTIFFLFLVAEMVSYYYDLSEIYPVQGLRVIAIKGFAGNKNITAASIAFKIPFAIYFFLNSKKLIFKIISL